jgi:hypothetical protein
MPIKVLPFFKRCPHRQLRNLEPATQNFHMCRAGKKDVAFQKGIIMFFIHIL